MSYSGNIAGIVFALGILAVIFIVPIALIFFIARQFKSWLARALIIFAFIAIPAALLIFSGLIGTSTKRIEKEHCISVPSSASNIKCEPFFAISVFIDGGGTASFEMSRGDLPVFITQFKQLRTQDRAEDPNDWTVNHDMPRNFGHTIYNFTGFSHDGNVMHIDVHDIDTAKVGVWIGTISN